MFSAHLINHPLGDPGVYVEVKYRRSALQSGDLARRAGTKRMVLFHFSPKHKGCGDLPVDEATRVFNGQILLI